MEWILSWLGHRIIEKFDTKRLSAMRAAVYILSLPSENPVTLV